MTLNWEVFLRAAKTGTQCHSGVWLSERRQNSHNEASVVKMQLLHLGMNMLKGGIRLEWDSWMAGKVKTQEKVGLGGKSRETEPFLQYFSETVLLFSQAQGASPAMAPRASLSASALRPVLECCRQLGVM